MAENSPRSERAPVPSRSDFSFAFQDQRFCDCILRIHVSADAASGSSGSETVSRIREVPVSTLVLAVNSLYFKTMFTGSFLEGSDRAKVDILMEPEYEPHMDELLHFMYFGILPPHTRKCSASILKLLVLADRFDAEDCFDACCEALCNFLPDLKASDALHIVALLNPIQQDPRLERAAQRARECIVRTYSPMLANPSKYAFHSLPKVGLMTLLDAEDLETESEDDVIRAAWSWVKGNYQSSEEWNEALCRFVLPRVRVQALSPKMVHWVCARVAEQIKSSWQTAHPSVGDKAVPDAPDDTSPTTAHTIPARGSLLGQPPGSDTEESADCVEAGPDGSSTVGSLPLSMSFSLPGNTSVTPAASSDGSSGLRPEEPADSEDEEDAIPSLGAVVRDSRRTRRSQRHGVAGASSGDGSPREARHKHTPTPTPTPRSARTGESPVVNKREGEEDVEREEDQNKVEEDMGMAERGLSEVQASSAAADDQAPASRSSDAIGGHARRSSASGADNLPPAALEAISALTAALVAMSEQLLVQSRMLPRGMSLNSCLTGLPLKKPRAACFVPEGRLSLEVQLRKCREWQPSSASLAASSPILFHGRWLTLNAIVDDKDSLGLYIQFDKALNAQDGSKQEFKLSFDIGIQTSKSKPAYQSIQKKKPKQTFTRREIEAGTGWGNAMGVSWSRMLQEHKEYFPEGALRLRADLWLVHA